MQANQIATIETLAANALVAHHKESYDGWRLRYNGGVTRRANSVLAEFRGSLPLAEKIARAEDWYKQLGVKARFQLCSASQPEHLLAELLRRGYSRHSGAHIQIGTISDLLSKASRTVEVSLMPAPSKEWLELYEITENAAPEKAHIRRQMLERLEPLSVFALAKIKGENAAVGLGVFENDYVGIFNMATLPAMRKKGAASTILQKLAHWGQQQGARQLYLQVATENLGAQQVYEKLGFSTLYKYEYLEEP
jgi:ribosomal protein S18 acetylase RimI-like enzyme